MKGLLTCLVLLAFGQSSQPVRNDEPTPVTSATVQRLRQMARDGGWWLMQQPSEQVAIDSTLAALQEKGASQRRLSPNPARMGARALSSGIDCKAHIHFSLLGSALFFMNTAIWV